MLGKAIIVVYLRTVRPDQENLILWLDTEQIKELCLLHVMRFLKELQRIKIRILAFKCNSACLKYTMREYRIC